MTQHWSLTLALLAICLPAVAADLTVAVSGLKNEKGEVGCALFRSSEGFPMDNRKAVAQWQKAKPGLLECKFENVEAGSYAVAVSLDLNGNRKTDKNFVGMPTEDWGVSNNVRPKLRAPRFDEAMFVVKEGLPTRIEIGLAR